MSHLLFNIAVLAALVYLFAGDHPAVEKAMNRMETLGLQAASTVSGNQPQAPSLKPGPPKVQEEVPSPPAAPVETIEGEGAFDPVIAAEPERAGPAEDPAVASRREEVLASTGPRQAPAEADPGFMDPATRAEELMRLAEDLELMAAERWPQ
ncbi:MAG: hypothetical protein ACPGOV_06610 [Magnetovibrionaceae bacterium]